MDAEDSFATGQSISEDYQQSLNKALEIIGGSQKKLTELTSEFYASYFSIMSEIMRKSFDYYSTLMNNFPMYPLTFFRYQQRTT
jgi:hypothetical protein